MKKRRNISVPVVAMADIAFLLLIFLMVTSLASPQKNIHLSLPKIITPEKIAMKNTENIFVDKEGKCFLEGKETTLENLEEKLYNIAMSNKNITIFLHADEDTDYAYVDKIVTRLYLNKLQKCVFVTKKTRQIEKNKL